VTARTGKQYLDSDEKMVYLATQSAPVYACGLALQQGGADSNAYPCIVEVDTSMLPFDDLFPDEDYVAIRLLQEELGLPQTAMPDERHERRLTEIQKAVKADPDARKGWVCESLRTLGSIAHRGGIPLAAITRISVLDNRDAFGFLSGGVDAIKKSQSGVGLTDIERQLCPPLTRWLSGNDVSADEFPAEMRSNAKSIEYITSRIAVRPRTVYERT